VGAWEPIRGVRSQALDATVGTVANARTLFHSIEWLEKLARSSHETCAGRPRCMEPPGLSAALRGDGSRMRGALNLLIPGAWST